jgi:hypothetical protein
MLLEITEGANRQLSSAFRTPSAPEMNAAARQLADSLAAEDAMSGCQDLRAVAATRPVAIPGATPTSLPALAATAARAVREAEQVARALPRPAHDGLALWA